MEAPRATMMRPCRSGGMADAAVSNTAGGNLVWVRIPPSAPTTTVNRQMTETTDSFIAYPDRAVLAVVDDAAEAEAAMSDLQADGFAETDITLLQGPEGADRIDGMGKAHGLGSRLRRLMAFTVMDQLPDFVLYERALRDGRSVLIVHAPGDADKRRAHAILRAHGGHFANYYGRFATEELDLWRGPEPDIPGVLRR